MRPGGSGTGEGTAAAAVGRNLGVDTGGPSVVGNSVDTLGFGQVP